MNSPRASHPSTAPFTSPRKRRLRPGVRTLAAGIGLILVVAGLALPAYTDTCGKSQLSIAMSQSKQIGLALRMYAGDHDGMYPSGIDPDGEPIHNANDAFRCLFPAYVTTETIFGNALSAYQTKRPDNVIAPKARILETGENVYSYIEGLSDSDDPKSPLVLDGTDGTDRGLYVTDPRLRGGVWKGERALVLHLDDSVSIIRLTGPANARIASGVDSRGTYNLLAADNLGAHRRLLNPSFQQK